MLPKEKIDRINYLAKQSKEHELTEEEKAEQKLLREEYLAKFRENFKKQLECIHFAEDENTDKMN